MHRIDALVIFYTTFNRRSIDARFRFPSERNEIGQRAKKKKEENLSGIAKNDFGRNFIVPSRNDGQMKFRR